MRWHHRMQSKKGTMLALARDVLDQPLMAASSSMDLLLVHADDHTPVLEDGITDRAAALAPVPVPTPAPGWLWSTGADANDLERQRWGIVAPLGPNGDRLLDAVAPLRAHREAQQGGRPIQIYRVPSDLNLVESMQWKQRHLRRENDLEVDIPRYLLIVGDLDQVPMSLHTALATDGFVGRLAFDHEDDYRAYVTKVLHWEHDPAAATSADAVLHTVHDGSAAARSGYHALMAPGLEILCERQQLGDVCAGAVHATGSTPPALSDVWNAATTDRPCVLFSHAHGEGAPRPGWRSPTLQRRYQGAMCLGRGLRLTGRDLAERSFLPGGVWLLLACFSAGTPTTSGYQNWLEELQRMGHVGREVSHVFDALALERPFIAAVPKAALANPDGPLAFVGHVDLAWSYSFLDIGPGAPRGRPGRFMNLVQSLLAGDRAGVALHTLFCALGQVQTELSALMEQAGQGLIRSRRERTRRAHLWMMRHDLAGYVLLGDPAVHLPLAGKRRPAEYAPGHKAATAPHAAHGLPLPIGELERTVASVLNGDAQISRVARTYGMTESELRALVERYRTAGRRALQDA
jgi:hypothetical protein